MSERAPRRSRAEPKPTSSKGGEPPRGRTAIATTEPSPDKIQKTFGIIETMTLSELRELANAVREKLI
ncbi:hypothetical protein A2870_00980 [Candidatus Curtissbacteria bacterium RIFCSPHIGHO2_01_FULL_41_11]|uniref:Uncharacterized protein n=1 Tax=Candidatus Curtissbacteria bacterium RIFCSPHIGHO2_01_FULL_41_11 TaxID=1797711 RepID=A0A1F5G3K2_9BACT|nr:MAG: hypothetical protein A2870_00980 [Candidatus Curtissbacteria bacterium RIFCSPHIGHO2_01_FULL_41_11]